jgi:Protein of unknown function (DUF3631)
VLLLSDIRDIFNRHPTVDRLASAVIVAELCELPDGIWSEWRGPKEDQVPRRFTQGNLALLLRPFSIRPKTIWPARRGMNDKPPKAITGSSSRRPGRHIAPAHRHRRARFGTCAAPARHDIRSADHHIIIAPNHATAYTSARRG